MGKSRLVEELVAQVGRAAAVVRGRCLSHGRGITFWPVVEIVRKAAGILEEDPPDVARAKIADLAQDDAVARRVAAAVGLSGEEFPVEETFWGVRKLFETMAAARPLVVVFEDVHWAESTMLDLVEHVLGSSERPILLVCLARHELLDIRPAWEKLSGSSVVVPRAAFAERCRRAWRRTCSGTPSSIPMSAPASWRPPRATRSSSSRCFR